VISAKKKSLDELGCFDLHLDDKAPTLQRAWVRDIITEKEKETGELYLARVCKTFIGYLTS
jgi:hypothetical protein